ncbi:ClpP family protease [Nonlabens marinus]|uniref:ATP-dependent Clp protease proteolytic subunit n=1 Tax=Nonlabens marinus S1-08 TaxID=1454201 RepID=W8VVK3_9FLAO|nr:ATP-dependent Clp protease proteolytic subunit [Nonlabens marinus]BAO55523.1 ATP-dependent Clp protease proteolytic subunit [Nonlabens marinus S1-08]
MSKLTKLQDKIDENFIEQRKLFIWGMVDDKTARHCVDRLLYLDSLSNDEITFVINSPGGYVTAGFSIYDTMKQIKSPVSTVCSGLAASMGSILLSGGEKGRRFMQKHGRVMIHQPSGGARGTGADLEITAKEILKTKELSAQILADNCGQSFEKVMKDFNRDFWMGAEEAVTYGIADGVL